MNYMNPDKPRTDAIDTYIRTRNDYTKTDHQVWREHSGILETELAAFKKNNEELIQRHNAAIASWDEERERALRLTSFPWKELFSFWTFAPFYMMCLCQHRVVYMQGHRTSEH